MPQCLSYQELALQSILLVDDHAIFRQGLRDLLLVEFPGVVITEVATGRECLDVICRQNFDLVFLDLNLPDKSGLAVLHEAKADGLTSPVIVLSMYSEKQFGLRVLKSHGASYLCKDCTADEVTHSVRMVLKKKKYLTPQLQVELDQELDHTELACLHATLSDRELEVLRLLSLGRTPTQVATHLVLSVKTISTHRARLLEKLNLRTTAELIRYAIINQLFEDFNI